jgi:hypothetical protein
MEKYLLLPVGAFFLGFLVFPTLIDDARDRRERLRGERDGDGNAKNSVVRR